MHVTKKKEQIIDEIFNKKETNKFSEIIISILEFYQNSYHHLDELEKNKDNSNLAKEEYELWENIYFFICNNKVGESFLKEKIKIVKNIGNNNFISNLYPFLLDNIKYYLKSKHKINYDVLSENQKEIIVLLVMFAVEPTFYITVVNILKRESKNTLYKDMELKTITKLTPLLDFLSNNSKKENNKYKLFNYDNLPTTNDTINDKEKEPEIYSKQIFKDIDFIKIPEFFNPYTELLNIDEYKWLLNLLEHNEPILIIKRFDIENSTTLTNLININFCKKYLITTKSDNIDIKSIKKYLNLIFEEIDNENKDSVILLDITKLHKKIKSTREEVLTKSNIIIYDTIKLVLENIDNKFDKYKKHIFKYEDLVELKNDHKREQIIKINNFDKLPKDIKHLILNIKELEIETITELIQKWHNNEDKLREFLKRYMKTRDIYVPSETSVYNLDYLNINLEGLKLKDLIKSLKKEPKGKFMFYGISGTGKSAFGNYIAEQLNRKFMYKKINEMYVNWMGETEKRIAQVFAEANDKKAILMIDEVDGLLNDRNNESGNYEKNIINEFLVQIEKFDGILIMTTNLLENIDPAFIRRFDLKIEFKALKTNQKIKLFTEYADNMNIRYEEKDLKKLKRIEELTVGDFANVTNQQRFFKILDSKDFIKRLKKEVKLKFDY